MYAWTLDRPQMAVSVHTVNVQQHNQYQSINMNINEDSQSLRCPDMGRDVDSHNGCKNDHEEEKKSEAMSHLYASITSPTPSSGTFPISISATNGNNVHYSPTVTII